MHDAIPIPYLRETMLFLAVAGLLIPLLQRLRFNQIFGFLIAGALLGPLGLASLAHEQPWLQWVTFPSHEGFAALGELGVMFLMFTIGLEMSLQRLVSLRRWVFGVGTGQLLVSAAAIGLLARAAGATTVASIVIGFSLAFSSTAVVMQLLTRRREVGTPLGRASFSVLLLQDLAVAPVLVLAIVLGADVEPLTATGLALVKGLAAVVLIYLIGNLVIRPLFRQLSLPGQPDSLMALTVVFTLAIAVATQLAGLSLALGALLAGVLLSETEFRHEIELTLAPFRGLLLGLFFFSVGMGFDVRALVTEPMLLPAAVAGLFVLKAIVLAPMLRLAGLERGAAVEGGLLLGQAGEFGFVVLAAAIAAQTIDADAGRFAMWVIGLSLVATPLVARIGQALRVAIDRRWWSGSLAAADSATPGGHVVIAGFGRVGRMLAEMFDRESTPYVAIDADPRVVAAQRDAGRPAHFGDASRPELLRRLGLENAVALVVTIDEAAPALRIVNAIRSEFPQLPIFARAVDEKHARQLSAAGAEAVIPETLESTLRLGALVMTRAGVAEADVDRLVREERDRRIAGETVDAINAAR
ncbi:MAG TPA: cation:proton antiporter [Burkholderiaceae bacterium]|nr:cation:proton antiporter [Burkholderiaceae bacterium]